LVSIHYKTHKIVFEGVGQSDSSMKSITDFLERAALHLKMLPNMRTDAARNVIRRAVEAGLLIEEKDGSESVLCWDVHGCPLDAVSTRSEFRLLYQATLGPSGRRTVGGREGLRKSVVVPRLLKLMREENTLHHRGKRSSDSAGLTEVSEMMAQKKLRLSNPEEVKQYLERAISNHVVTLFWKNHQPELRLVKGKRVASEFEILKQIMTDERIAGRATPNGGIPRATVASRIINHNGQATKSKNATVPTEQLLPVRKDQSKGKLNDTDRRAGASCLQFTRLPKKQLHPFVYVSAHSFVIALVAFMAGLFLAGLCSSSLSFVCRVVLPASFCPKSSLMCSPDSNPSTSWWSSKK
jgi:hypothetical protein